MIFVQGHWLSGALHAEIVAPMMANHFSGMPYAAALIGAGSDVLGYDTERSMDHDWGPRLTILFKSEDIDAHKSEILAVLDTVLPAEFHGIPIDIPGSTSIPGDELRHHHVAGSGRMHGIRIETVHDVVLKPLGVDSIENFDVGAWMTTPQQSLLELTAGPIFHDDIGDVTRIRATLAWYPEDIWKYQMAAGWKRIAQLEAFVGRCGELGDDAGSQLIAMSLVQDSMKLAFLQSRTYAPYAKWLGTVFSRLDIASGMAPSIEAIRFARTWQERETGLIGLVTVLAESHNELAVSKPVEIVIREFHNRPFRVIFAERFSRALRDSIVDPWVRALPIDIGGIDQFIDSTDALGNRSLRLAMVDWYREFRYSGEMIER